MTRMGRMILILMLLTMPMVRQSAAKSALKTIPISVVNHSRLPVHAAAVTIDEGMLRTAFGVPEETALRVLPANGGAPVPITRGIQDGRPVVRIYASLPPASRLDLAAEPAERWEEATVAEAACDAAQVSGMIRNGIVQVTFGKKGWELALRGMDADAAVHPLLKDGGLDFWIDDQNRGRIMNSDPKDLGLARYANSKVQGCEASVTPDGRSVFRIVRRMDGLASAMTVTETFELVPGLPILVCRVQWRNDGDRPLWVAYTGSGNGVYGKWAKDGLMSGPLIQRKKSPIAGDIDGGETRPAWLPQLCRISMESPATGCGIGMSTLLPTPKNVGVGSMVWGCGAGGFQCNFIDPVQGQFPFLVKPRSTLENGFAFLATQADASPYRQVVELWTALQSARMPALAPPCAVYLDGQPLTAQSVRELPGGKDGANLLRRGVMQLAALRMDFNKHYECRVSVQVSSPGDALELAARPLAPGQQRIVLLRTDTSGEHVIPLNRHFKADEIEFVLEARTSGSAAIKDLSIVEILPVAPRMLSPMPDAVFTDIAMMFRWQPLPMVVDYDIEWSRSADFASPVRVRVRQSQETPWYLPPERLLPAPGRWHWRIRGVKGDILGDWSAARAFTVNNDHSTRPPKRPITARSPLFTLEASKVTDFRSFTPDIPADVASHVGIIVEGFVAKHLTIDEAMRGVEKMPHPFMIRSHPPTWLSLADLEWACQNMPNFIGMQGGETLSTLYAEDRGLDNGDADYHRRMLRICAKYGLIYQEADGTYRDDKWQDLMDNQGPFIRAFGPWLVLTQKNNIIRRQFYSQSATMGLWLGGITHQHGAWEDGGFYWQNAGFNGLGNCEGERRGVLKTMPRNFWSLVFVMGIGRGCGIYSLDGQTLMENPKEIERFPHARFPATIWMTDGRTTDTFKRFVLPLIRGVIQHDLIPTREQVQRNVRLAVYNDRQASGDARAWPYYVEYGPLYAATYGFRTMGNIDGQLWEFFPNTGRYFYIPVLVQGNEPIAGVRNIPVSQLQEVGRVREVFDAAYPKWYDGEALACLVGDTLTVQNTHENQDATESFTIPLNRGRLVGVSGTIGPHAYIVGKIGDDGRLWLQTNGEYPDRITKLSIRRQAKPRWRIEPAAAAREAAWDEASRALALRLSHEHGAVEVVVE